MDYVVTLNNVHKSDVDKVGNRAVDLAELSRKRFDVPLAFVLTSQALEEFVTHNRLQEKGAEYLASDDYDSLRQAALRGDIPTKIVNEIKEAYQTLAVDPESDADNIVGSEHEPYATLIPSPNYHVPARHYEGIFQNVKGLGRLIEGIKMAWASLFTRHAFEHRDNIDNREFYSGLIVQKMPESETSATATAEKDSSEIEVETWFGYPEYGMGVEKDNFTVSREGLQIKEHDVRHQLHRLIRDEEGELDEISMGDRGEQQKIDDKTVIELARLAKKASNQLGTGVHNYYTLDKENNIHLLLTNRTIHSGESEEDPQPAEQESAIESPEEATAKEVERVSSEDWKEKEGIKHGSGTSLPEKEEDSWSPQEPPVQEEPEDSEEDEDDEKSPWAEEPETGEEPDEDEQEDFMKEVEKAHSAISEDRDGTEDLPGFGGGQEDDDFWQPDEEPEDIEERVDEAGEHVDRLKELVHELDELVEQGETVEVRHKLNELDKMIRKLRDHH